MPELRWTQIDSWHIIDRTWFSRNDTAMVETLCGIERIWDQTFLDRLPGGDEKSCENCLKIHTRASNGAPSARKKKATKKA